MKSKISMLVAAVFLSTLMMLNLHFAIDKSESFDVKLSSMIVKARTESSHQVSFKNRKHRWSGLCYYQCLDNSSNDCDYTHDDMNDCN